MVCAMMRWILMIGLWLFGTSGTANAEVPRWVGQGERLDYGLSFGPLGLGTATLAYTPHTAFVPGAASDVSGSYGITGVARAKVPFLSLEENLASRGIHVVGVPFRPTVYTTRQHENSYRSDKVLKFDWKALQTRYQNKLDVTDVADKPLALVPTARDMLSALYALRMEGRTVLGRGVDVPMVGLKRLYRLKASKGPIEKLKLGDGKKVWAYRIPLVMEEVVDGKPVSGSVKDSWTIWATDTVDFVPVRVEAKMKFGTFTAVLKRMP